MGRRKGSKNKVKRSGKAKKVKKPGKIKKPQKIKKIKKTGNGKRGRPKGSKNKSRKKLDSIPDINQEEENYVPPKSHKVLGACPVRQCSFVIGSLDLESKYVFVCPSCGKRARTNKLKEIRRQEDLPTSKKEYLSSTINAKHLDMPELLDEVVDIKVQE